MRYEESETEIETRLVPYILLMTPVIALTCLIKKRKTTDNVCEMIIWFFFANEMRIKHIKYIYLQIIQLIHILSLTLYYSLLWIKKLYNTLEL